MQHQVSGHYAVIFTARIRNLDDAYLTTATRMRELAMSEFGCYKFNAACEGDTEIAISYWSSLEQIRAWRNHPEHKIAQKQGQDVWYAGYSVEITRIDRAYSSSE
ncbi:MAG: antibiotic biosynthesis monooxygenase [Halioglobus sp.]